MFLKRSVDHLIFRCEFVLGGKAVSHLESNIPPGIPDQFSAQESYIPVDFWPSLYSALLASSKDTKSQNTPLLSRTRVHRLLYISIKGKRKERDRRKKIE
jgi:hypothetical protein